MGSPFIGLQYQASRRSFLTVSKPHGSFYDFGVLFVSVLLIRALLFGVYDEAPDFGKLSYQLLEAAACQGLRSARPGRAA